MKLGLFISQLRPYEDFLPGEWDQTIESLSFLEGIRSVSREHSGMGLAYAGQEQAAVNVRGIDPALYEKDSGFRGI